MDDTSNSDNEDPSAPLLPPSTNDDDFDEDDAFAVLARVTDSPDLVPWERRSTKMKIVYVADRIFLCFLAIFALVLMVEVCYIVYYAIPWMELSRGLTNWLLTQEDGEEDLDL